MCIMFKGCGQCVSRSYENRTFVSYMRTGSAIDHSSSFSLVNILRSHTNYITGTCVVRVMVWLPFELLFSDFTKPYGNNLLAALTKKDLKEEILQ